MKRLLIILFLLIFPINGDTYNLMITGGGTSAGGAGGGDCDWSSADLAWDGEASTNTDWCKENDTTLSGSLSGATIVSCPGAEGGDCLLLDATNDELSVGSITTSEFDPNQGYIKCRIYVENHTGNTTLIGVDDGSGGYLRLEVQNAEALVFYYRGNYTISMTYSTPPTIQTWYDLYLAWDNDGNIHGQGATVISGMCMGASCGTPGAGDWEYETDGDTTNDLGAISTFSLKAVSFNNDAYLNNVEVYTTTDGS